MKLPIIFRILQVLLAPMFGLFAAGASAMGGGDGGSLAATLGDGSDGGAGDGAEGDEGAGEGDGAGAGDGTDGAAAGEGGEGDGAAAADGRKMPAALRSHIAELKAAGKADLAKELNTQYWSLRKLNSDVQQHFPGGLKEAIALKQQIEEVGGVDRFHELESEAQEYRQVDELIEAGDPKVVSSMFEQFPEGMAAIMPAALEQWSEADSENYDRHMAGIAHATLQSSGMSNDMQLAYALLEQYDLEKNPSLKRVAQLLAKGQTWLTNLGKYAQEKPAANARGGTERGNDKLTAREQKVQQQERQQTIRAISSNFQAFTTPKFNSALTAELKGKAIPATGKQAVFQQAMVNIMKVLGAGGNAAKGIKGDFERKYDAYLDNGDQDGALKLLKSRAEPLLQKAVQDAYKYLYGDATLGSKKKPGAAGAGAGADGKDKGGAGGNTDGGFELIGYDPKPDSIDRVKTTRSMIFKNQAILKNGKKVTWKKGAPAEK